MLDRIKYGWNLRRAAYLIMGALIVYQSVMDKAWTFAVFGLYFFAMGLFGFGCASGYCMPMDEPRYKSKMSTTEVDDVHYEEVISKK